MTLVRHRLTTPSGQPLRRWRITARLVAPAGLLADSTGQIIESTQAVADVDGWCELELTPQSKIAAVDSYYAVRVDGQSTPLYCVVPDAGPVQLAAILVDPGTLTPTPVPPASVFVLTGDPRLSDTRTPKPHAHPTADVTGLDTALAGKVTLAAPSEVNLGLRTGIDRTGATDISAILQAAADEGRPIYLPEGDYLVNGVTLAHGVRIRGAGTGRTRLLQAGIPSVLNFVGSRGASVLLTADAAAGATAIALTSTAAIATGDYLNLRSVKLWPGTDKAATFGEMIRVASVNGSTVNLRAPLEDSYAVADGAVVETLTQAADIEVTDLTIENPAWGTKIDPFALLNIDYGRHVTLGGLDLVRADAQGIALYATTDFTVDNCRFFDLSDSPANIQYGYGVDVRESTCDGVVHGCYMRGGRHLFTTNAMGVEGNTPLGVPRHITVSDCVATETSNAPFDTHFEGSDITFANNRAHGVRAWGMAIRARRVTVNGFDASNTIGPGVWVRENAIEAHLRNIRIRNARTGVAGDGVTYQGQGLRMQAAAPSATISDLHISNTDEDGVYIGGGGSGVHRLSNVHIANVGLVTNRNGIRFGGAASAGHQFTDVTLESCSVGILGTAATTDVRARGLRTVSVAVRVQGLAVAEDQSYAGAVRQRGKSGYYYRAAAPSVSTATGTLNEMRVGPVSFDQPTPLAAIGLEITTAVPSSTVRLIVYADDGFGSPAALVLDAGTIDGSTTGFKEIPVNPTLPAGDYHLGGIPQGAAAATYRVNTGDVQGVPILVPAGNSGSNSFARSGVAGAAPATFGVPSFIGGNCPRVYLKAA